MHFKSKRQMFTQVWFQFSRIYGLPYNCRQMDGRTDFWQGIKHCSTKNLNKSTDRPPNWMANSIRCTIDDSVGMETGKRRYRTRTRSRSTSCMQASVDFSISELISSLSIQYSDMLNLPFSYCFLLFLSIFLFYLVKMLSVL